MQGKTKVLFIDDENSFLEILKLNLEKKCPQVIAQFAGSAIEAYRMTLENHYDYIFVDCFMPNFSGVEFIKNIELVNGTKVYLLTAFPEKVIEEYKTIEGKSSGILDKVRDKDVLYSILNNKAGG